MVGRVVGLRYIRELLSASERERTAAIIVLAFPTLQTLAEQ